MAMTPLGDGSKKSGYFTDLSIAQEFANAVCHFLRDHAKPREGGGRELPLNQEVWEDVLRIEYNPEARRTAQTLKAYCEKYYNGGQKGHGYDEKGKWDCGTSRFRTNRKGKSIAGTAKAVYPGINPPFMKPEAVIEIVRERLAEIPTDRARAAAAKLKAQLRNRSTTRKRATARKTKRKTKQFSFAVESAIEGIRREVRWFARTRNRPLRDRILAKANGRCDACRRNFSKVLGGKGTRVLLVHHNRRQLSDYDPGGQVTSEKDLAVVCANCHMLLHINPKRSMDVKTLRRKLSAK